MSPEHLRKYIIRPTLDRLGLDNAAESRRAEYLLMGTAAVESDCGYFLVQSSGGPALGIFQMEPSTHDDIWKNYLEHRDGLKGRVEQLLMRFRAPQAAQLVVNPMYACAMARVLYRRSPLPLPMDLEDIQGAWRIYKEIYNTHLGATEFETFEGKWRRYVL